MPTECQTRLPTSSFDNGVFPCFYCGMTTTTTQPKLAERAVKLKEARAADGIEVTVEEAQHLLICDFIDQLRKG